MQAYKSLEYNIDQLALVKLKNWKKNLVSPSNQQASFLCQKCQKFQNITWNKFQVKINKMNKKEQELFVAFFEQTYEAEEAFQFIKKQMNRCLGYNPALLFDLISGRSNQITINQMRDFLIDRVACNERELYDIFQRMDWSRNGFISRDDFVRQITPFGEPTPSLGNSGTVTAQIEGHFLSLITEYLKRFRIIEVSRKEVDFITPYNAFDQIDYARSGIIGIGQLQRFFRVNDFNISELQLNLLLHGLRRRCYIHVNLQVFCQNLDPLEFGQYEAYQRNIDSAQQTQFLKRSRREQETMRRSRIQSQKIQHNIAKQQRRKRAELERQLELQQRINKQIRSHEENKDRYLRRAMLEEDKNIRWNIQAGGKVLEQEAIRNIVQSQRNQELGLIREQENQINTVLARSALRRQDDLEASRRARAYEREIAMRQELERQNNIRRRQWVSEVDHSRRMYEQELRAERDRAQRQYELDRIRNLQVGGSASRRHYGQISESKRINDLERELERTKMEMREKQSRFETSGKRNVPDTADRSFGYRT